jgi:hypothetical protein
MEWPGMTKKEEFHGMVREPTANKSSTASSTN